MLREKNKAAFVRKKRNKSSGKKKGQERAHLKKERGIDGRNIGKMERSEPIAVVEARNKKKQPSLGRGALIPPAMLERKLLMKGELVFLEEKRWGNRGKVPEIARKRVFDAARERMGLSEGKRALYQEGVPMRPKKRNTRRLKRIWMKSPTSF